MVISGSHALYLIFVITLCNVNLFFIQGANKVVVVVVVVVVVLISQFRSGTIILPTISEKLPVVY